MSVLRTRASQSRTYSRGTKYSRAGTFNLPIELWQDIYATALSLTRNEQRFFMKNDSWACSSEPNRLLRSLPEPLMDFDEDNLLALFAMRRSIVLVCKSWYFMAISTLWSHVRINVGNSMGQVANILSILRRSSTLASYVIRLSVKVPSLAVSTNPPSAARDSRLLSPEEVQNSRLLAKILPLLTRIRVVSLPHLIRPQTSIESIVISYNEHTKSPLPVISGLKNQIIGLFKRRNAEDTLPKPTQISVVGTNTGAFEWTSGIWDLSTVRNLSVSHHVPQYWAKTLGRFRLSLEELEILIDARINNLAGYEAWIDKPPFIEMPRLKILCLTFPEMVEGNDSVRWWLKRIRAPNLIRIVFHCNAWSQRWSCSTRVPLSREVEAAVGVFPKLKEVGILADWKSIMAHDERIPNLLTKQDIVGWCNSGLVVEIITRQEGERRTYTKDNLP